MDRVCVDQFIGIFCDGFWVFGVVVQGKVGDIYDGCFFCNVVGVGQDGFVVFDEVVEF